MFAWHIDASSYDIVRFIPAHRPPSDTAGWDQSSLVQRPAVETLQLTEDEDLVVSRRSFLRRVYTPSGGYNHEVLRSGTVIKLQTNDSNRYPHPHPDLLRLLPYSESGMQLVQPSDSDYDAMLLELEEETARSHCKWASCTQHSRLIGSNIFKNWRDIKQAVQIEHWAQSYTDTWELQLLNERITQCFPRSQVYRRVHLYHRVFGCHYHSYECTTHDGW